MLTTTLPFLLIITVSTPTRGELNIPAPIEFETKQKCKDAAPFLTKYLLQSNPGFVLRSWTCPQDTGL